MTDRIGAVGEKKTTSNTVDYIKKYKEMIKTKGGDEGAAAFTAYITPQDFAKRGQVPAPGLTEGGSVWTS